MATVTPNFNWPVPTSTDLVKDGATAIEALGDSIDASLVDLKGGTTGQVLSKTSGTDMDFTWVTSDDANAIQNTIVDAKGDLIAASAADTPARLAVGNNGETLVADSSAATGLKWAKSANFVGVGLYNSTTQSILNNTLTAISFDAEYFDTDGFHSTVSNTARITIPAGLGGKYLITMNSLWEPNGFGRRQQQIYKNSSQEYVSYDIVGNASNYIGGGSSIIISCNAGDYLEFAVTQNSGSTLLYYKRYQEYPIQVQYLGA
jgi:hypothetical protein